LLKQVIERRIPETVRSGSRFTMNGQRDHRHSAHGLPFTRTR
jgi:hypothetical protein